MIQYYFTNLTTKPSYQLIHLSEIQKTSQFIRIREKGKQSMAARRDRKSAPLNSNPTALAGLFGGLDDASGNDTLFGAKLFTPIPISNAVSTNTSKIIFRLSLF